MTEDEIIGALGLWVAGLCTLGFVIWAISLIIVPLLIVAAVVVVGYGLYRGWQALGPSPLERELAAIDAERNAAVQRIIEIRQAATHEMVAIAREDEDVIEGTGREVS